MQEIKISNNHDTAVIDIEGTIGIPEQWQFEHPQERVATYETFRQTLQQIEQLNASRIVVNIRSTGGDVNDALLIYEALTSLDAAITTRCWGYVASAATVIAQAASDGQREISPNALYLVHSSSCAVEGTAAELANRVELLKKTDERLAELYARRSGYEASRFAELMAEEGGAGRWLNASETIEMGLADVVIESSQQESSQEESTEEESVQVDPSVVESALASVKGLVKRLGQQLGIVEERVVEAPVNLRERPINVTHADAVEPTQRMSTIEFDEQQRELKPSIIEPTEDPSLVEITRTANQSAYDHDASRIRLSR
ncbi:MAG: Clp protease ClpP [Rikenellaceae bacterium]